MQRCLIVLVVGLIVCLSTPVFCAELAEFSDANQFRIGLGGGVPYGGIGMNAEYRFNTYVSAGAGVGYRCHESPGFAAGAMLYPWKNDGFFNPRLSGYFGRVSTLKRTHSGETTYRPIYGGALGAGFDMRIYKRLAFGADVFYLMKDLPSGYGDGVGIAGGFGIMF